MPHLNSTSLKYSLRMVILSAICAITACSNSNTPAESPTTSGDGNTVSNDTKILRIATEGAYAPFNFTKADGSLGGFDVDIASALCADMQVTCDIVAQDWDGIIPGLKAGKYDAIVAAMSVTEDRQKQVDFTEPYFHNSLVFLADKNSNFDPNNDNDINKFVIAAQRSTISSQWLEQRYPKAKMQLYDTLNNAFIDLSSGRAEAMVSDKLPAIAWLKTQEATNFEVKGGDIDIDDYIAIAVKKGDTELKDKLNTALAHIKADGTYDKIIQQYFEPTQTAANETNDETNDEINEGTHNNETHEQLANEPTNNGQPSNEQSQQ